MTRTARKNANTRWANLATRFKNDRFRDAYLDKSVKASMANQIRALRGDESQTAFGKRIDQTQSVVSRLENEYDDRAVNTQTLIDLAKRLRIGIIIEFVDFDRFVIKMENQNTASLPKAFDPESLENAEHASSLLAHQDVKLSNVLMQGGSERGIERDRLQQSDAPDPFAQGSRAALSPVGGRSIREQVPLHQGT